MFFVEGELEAGWLKEAGFADVVNHVVGEVSVCCYIA